MKTCLFKSGETIENALTFMDIQDSLDTFYELIHCDTIDIVERTIGERTYNFIVDDEALLFSDPVLAYVDPENFNCNIFGNIIIVSGEVDEEGELIGIEEDDYEYISHHVKELSNFPEPFVCVDPNYGEKCIIIK